MSASVGSGPRVLLRGLREVMAAGGGSQERLNKVVRVIASNMVAEVCSVYLMRQGRELELFATEGLNPEAVHKTRLKVGEGLVGDIAAHARPLKLKDAQSHPLFAYRPETGEEVYNSLMGVPILHGERVLGVVVVQNRTLRDYTEEELEALQTIAMVLAEMVAAGKLVDQAELEEAVAAAMLPERLDGRSFAEGLAIGRAVLHEPRIEVVHAIAENIVEEKRRLADAVTELRVSIEEILTTQEMAVGGESRAILEAYRMFAYDRGWLARLEAAVDSGLTAEAAVKRVHDETRARMNEISDPYLRERLADLDDLGNRLYQHIAGTEPAAARLPDDAVVVARTMGPAELLDYDRKKLRGVVLEEGSHVSHVAVVARALGIPLVGRCQNVSELVDPGDLIVVDGDHGQVFVRPQEDVVHAVRQNLSARAQRQAEYAALRDLPAVTKDGQAISLNINAGLLVDLQHLADTGADGVGLFRTELHFMVRASLPKVTEQQEYYRRVLHVAGRRPVVFRTLDIGGDKLLPYQNKNSQEENPTLGWRAIRIALDRPALLKTQLRALLQAAAGRHLHVMFPMVAEVAEFSAARALLNAEVQRIANLGLDLPVAIKVGTMLEVPSLAWQIEALLPLVDFVSIGSNDLTQFFFAVDRGSPRVAERYDLLSPAMLSFIRMVVRQCDQQGVPVSLCGEMAGRPIEAMALLGLGLRTVSMPPGAVAPVKDMVRHLDLARLQTFMEPLYSLPDHSLRDRLVEFAHDNRIPI